MTQRQTMDDGCWWLTMDDWRKTIDDVQWMMDDGRPRWQTQQSNRTWETDEEDGSSNEQRWIQLLIIQRDYDWGKEEGRRLLCKSEGGVPQQQQDTTISHTSGSLSHSTSVSSMMLGFMLILNKWCWQSSVASIRCLNVLVAGSLRSWLAIQALGFSAWEIVSPSSLIDGDAIR